jgi:hypothetical protein
MTKIIFTLTTFILILFQNSHAQETKPIEIKKNQNFENQVKSIADQIDKITKEEKAFLKLEIEAVNIELESGKISKEEAEAKKQKFAETRAKNIEDKIAIEQKKLNSLVQQKVDGKIKAVDSTETYTIIIHKKIGNEQIKKSEKRTTSQFVVAFGANNLLTNESIANSDFYYWKSHFFEWGFTKNTRVLKNDNLLHLKYGFSVMYNNLRPTDNRYFVTTNNNQTNLEVFPYQLEDSRFKNVYLVAPLHLEFDFSGNKSKHGNSSFSTHKGIRFGIGGYGGFRIKSKQKMCYDQGEDKVKIKTKGDFNANDFIYGVSTYLGYKETSLYLKYDIQALFEDNSLEQNNISLGVRFDFN